MIITNAHVAQFFLLETDANKNYMDCAVYKEGQAANSYEAKLLFISPTWIKNNYQNITQRNPIGTGANDYAFLYITGNLNPALSTPKQFDSAEFLTDHKYKKDNKIAIASYPGAPSKITNITQNINLKADNSQINDVFTLSGDTVDVISTDETKLAQKGSSGGGVFDINRNLIGLVVTISELGDGFSINAINCGRRF